MITIFKYSVGRKIIMSATGLFLCVFLVVHLSGNLLLFGNDGGAAFNDYSKFMSTNVMIRISEVILFLGFLFHIVDAVVLTIQNKKARPVNYAVNHASENSGVFSRTMTITGLIVFVFLVIHLNTFFVKHRILESEHSMYESVLIAFKDIYYCIFYVIAMILMGFHLNHGFSSSFQSLGINHKKYTKLLKCMGVIYSVAVPIGFASIPVYFYFK